MIEKKRTYSVGCVFVYIISHYRKNDNHHAFDSGCISSFDLDFLKTKYTTLRTILYNSDVE